MAKDLGTGEVPEMIIYGKTRQQQALIAKQISGHN